MQRRRSSVVDDRCHLPTASPHPSLAGDLGFEDSQLQTWRTAEAAAGIAAPTGAACKKKKTAAESLSVPLDPNEQFVAVKHFHGEQAGWRFGTSEKGTGYHREGIPAGRLVSSGPRTISLDSEIPLQACSQQLLAQDDE